VATGTVIGQTHRKHRHQEFLWFLKTIDKATPPDVLTPTRPQHTASLPAARESGPNRSASCAGSTAGTPTKSPPDSGSWRRHPLPSSTSDHAASMRFPRYSSGAAPGSAKKYPPP
jgi:hypothetical protein